jgi:murein DD-endopeptidase MepM/ murein hydrolase activator NlpD
MDEIDPEDAGAVEGMPAPDLAVSMPDAAPLPAPGEPKPAPEEEETAEQFMRRLVEENAWRMKPRPPRPVPPPEPKSIHLMTPEEMHESLPVHLRRRRPDGSYPVMGLISRMQTDLEELTQGKRAATYPEVDEYLGYALLAEGLAPRGLTAPEAVTWWRAGGSDVLRERVSNLPEEGGVADRMNRHDEIGGIGFRATPTGTAPLSPVQLAAAENGLAGAAGALAGIGRAQPGARNQPGPRSPTTESEMLKDIGTWPSGTARSSVPGKASARVPVAKAPVGGASPKTVASPIPANGKGATFPRKWPVPIPPGGVHLPRKGEKDKKGVAYSDGRYSSEGLYRRKKNGRPQRHLGSDVPGPRGAAVGAAADGVVLVAGTQWEQVWARDPKTKKRLLRKNKNGQLAPYRVDGPNMAGWGNYITVLHPDGYLTRYAHLQAVPPFKRGDKVRVGQQIGILGTTGNARGQGSHVHLEVRDENNTSYNPVDWMEGRLAPRKR